MLCFLNAFPTGMAELTPVYDRCKSFYGKAYVTFSHESGVLILRSYQTNVACFDSNEMKIVLTGQYSNTTNRHTWDFLRQLADEAGFDFIDIYNSILKDEKLSSFSGFLRKINLINLKTMSYTTFENKTFKI